jgi:hypothetical protein
MSKTTPIVFIGGLGGSGTRAVARVVAALGYYPGGCLNRSNDNLIFTELFNQPDWLRAEPPESEIQGRLTLFEEIMRSGIARGHLASRPSLAPFVARQGQGLAGQRGAVGWMTKEPNSHLFLPSILEHWPEAKFIYVARHPLDMAFSTNRNQLRNWGWRFSLEGGKNDSPEGQLEYWIRSEQRAEALAARFPGRVYRLRFDDFVLNVERELDALSGTLGVSPDNGVWAIARAEVIRPKSMGRYRDHDLRRFSQAQIEYCKAAGWTI